MIEPASPSTPNEPFSGKRRTNSRPIARTVGTGLFVTAALFTAISIISLFGFFNYRIILQELSEQIFPQATNEAQFSILLNQLLEESGHLYNSRTQPERRIAFDNIKTQFERINDFQESFATKLNAEHIPNSDLLAVSLTELNQRIEERIATQQLLLQRHAALLPLYRAIMVSERTMQAYDGNHATIALVNSFIVQATACVDEAQNVLAQQSLLQVNQTNDRVSEHLEQMAKLLAQLPKPLSNSAETLLKTTEETLQGKEGILHLAANLMTLSGECNDRYTFAQSLVGEKGDASIAQFFDLSSLVGQKTQLLSAKVETQIKILSSLFGVSILLASISFFYFRRRLIARLTRLNEIVMAMVAGENRQIEVDSKDEIGDIAWSVNYFVNELKKAKNAAEKSAEAKAEFLAHMSHEIRTPMNAIFGFTNLALQNNDQASSSIYLQKINSAAKSLLGIINSILDFSKIEAGKFTLEYANFDLRDLLQQLSSMISLRCEESELDFYFCITPGTPFALIGDSLRLGQILTNLIANAFKFTHTGYITVNVSTVTTPDIAGNPTSLCFSVQDTGKGIAEHEKDLLFKAFTQADTTITRRFGGTGLGLTICRDLVEMMGGKIWHEPREDGPGTAFNFTIPLKLQENCHGDFYKCPENLRHSRVLVMSSKPKTATELSWQLDNFGFDVFQALSFDEVEAALRQQTTDRPFHFVIIDAGLHLTNQAELIVKILNNIDEKVRPGVVITANGQYSEQSFLPSSKFVFLPQPILPNTLITSICSASGQEMVAEQLSTPPILISKLLSPQFQGKKIMVIEDNEINQMVIRDMLSQAGFVVTIAGNGAEALQMLQNKMEQPFSAIIMDVQMPVMDGFRTTETIRSLPSPLNAIPIIAVTAHALHEERERCFAVGMDGHIPKPIDPIELVTAITSFLTSTDRVNTTSAAQPDSIQISPHFDAGRTEGIDLRSGLARVMDNQELFVDLLKTFLKNYQDFNQVCSDLLFSINTAKLAKEVHTLKGSCGYLGFKKLFSLSESLEKSLKKDEITADCDLVREFGGELDRACSFAAAWLDQLPSNNITSKTSEADKVGADSTLNQEELFHALQRNLLQNNSRAIPLAKQIATLQPMEEQIIFTAIEQHINDLEYEKALALLQQWLEDRQRKQ